LDEAIQRALSGYLLVDGLRRLHAVMVRVAAVVEG